MHRCCEVQTQIQKKFVNAEFLLKKEVLKAY